MRLRNFDWFLFFLILLILFFGLAVCWSVNPALFPEQAIFAALGLVVFFVFSRLDFQIFSKLAWISYGLSLFLLVLPIFFGTITRGSIRWVKLGPISFQPSEVCKPLLIIFLAFIFSQKDKVSLKSVFAGLGLLALPIFLIFRQPDLGSALLLGFVFLGVIFASGVSWQFLTIGGVSIGLILPLVFRLLHSYQKQRITSFLKPNDPLGSGYNLIQAVVAVGSGQFFGRGLGKGTQSHLRFLPERHTDFIFASLSEELGLFGAAIMIGAFFFLLWRILKIGGWTKDRFGYLLVIGVFSLVFSQAFINIGMNLGLLPVTGVPLPLVSYGGNSLLSTMMSLGIVANISSLSARDKAVEIR